MAEGRREGEAGESCDVEWRVTGNGRRRQRAGGRERLVRVATWEGGLSGMGIESRR
jgi:hypothetical protein